MKKFLFISFILFYFISLCVLAKSKKTRRGSSRALKSMHSFSRKNASVSVEDKKILSGEQTLEVTKTEEGKDPYISCMDDICFSSLDEEKGRCRCSPQLARIEKVLRDIRKIQNEADERSKNLEILMNVSDSANVSENIGNVYSNINSIENKSKQMSFAKISKFGVMEGIPLYKKAVEQCSSFLKDKDEKQKNALEVDYKTKIESDCSAYTSILKDKADSASNLLTQTQKNQEKFDEQEYKKLNQVDVSTCFVEYETCMKTQCGENFVRCKEISKRNAFFKKCQSINYGRCEQNKSIVLRDLRKSIAKALEKERIAQNCRSSMGQIKDGKCLYQAQYRADKCTHCKHIQDEKWFSPGDTIICEDRRGGSFKDLVYGCHESCYLVSGKQVKYLGTNASDYVGLCKMMKNLDEYTLPVPDGWGRDGYPVSEELKAAF